MARNPARNFSIKRLPGFATIAMLSFFILYLPALWLSLSRDNRLVHHLVVLAAAAWLARAPGYGLFDRFDYGLLAYGLALAVFYVALGALALDRGLPSVLTACLPWGLLGLVLVPFIPGVRDIPRLIPIHRLVWRDWYRQERERSPQ